MPRLFIIAWCLLAVGRMAVSHARAGELGRDFDLTPPISLDSKSDIGVLWNQPARSSSGSRALSAGGQTQGEAAPSPQITVSFTPLSLASSRASAGPGREAGVWSVFVCSRSNERLIVPRAKVLDASPVIRWIPDGQRDAITRSRTQRNGWNVIGRGFKRFGPMVVAGVGVGYGGPAVGAALGFGLQALTGLAAVADELAPEYKLYAPLPAEIVLQPQGCAEHDILSSLVPGAAKHKGAVR